MGWQSSAAPAVALSQCVCELSCWQTYQLQLGARARQSLQLVTLTQPPGSIAEVGDTIRPANGIASKVKYINFCPIIIASVVATFVLGKGHF